MSDFYKRVSKAQNELKAPKNQRNSFGNYNYRSCEDILEAAKPICQKHGLMLNLSDKVVCVGERYYVEATATLFDTESELYIFSMAYARESETKKGMDDSQITGTASSYARKYALNGLFNIDDTKDADTNEYKKQTAIICKICGREISDKKIKGIVRTAKEIYDACGGMCTDCHKEAQKKLAEQG